jgi:hypothetical protein
MEVNSQNPFEGFEELNNLIFEKKPQTLEQKLLEDKKNIGIKVKSVFLPNNFIENRSESQLLDWLFNDIQSLNTVNYKLRLKYESTKQSFKLKYNIVNFKIQN